MPQRVPDYAVVRTGVPDEPLLEGYDYADSFEVRLARPDSHSAEQWVRTALEGSHPLIRRLIEVVHARVLKFDLGPSDDEHVLGWRITASDQGRLRLEAGGPVAASSSPAGRPRPPRRQARTCSSTVAALGWSGLRSDRSTAAPRRTS